MGWNSFSNLAMSDLFLLSPDCLLKRLLLSPRSKNKTVTTIHHTLIFFISLSFLLTIRPLDAPNLSVPIGNHLARYSLLQGSNHDFRLLPPSDGFLARSLPFPLVEQTFLAIDKATQNGAIAEKVYDLWLAKAFMMGRPVNDLSWIILEEFHFIAGPFKTTDMKDIDATRFISRF